MSLHSIIARPLLAAPFLADGIGAITQPQRHAEKVERVRPTLEKLGVPEQVTAAPELLTRALGVVTTVSALALATGRRPRTAAFTLALVTAPVALARNPVWTAQGEERKEMTSDLLAYAGLVGGLFTAAADRDGEPSLRWRMSNTLEQRRDIRAAKAEVKDKYTD
ncbi:DoxX family protein [Georgenia sp. Z1491]|uniref:DoxX family protein n=1 Tax=Georgenia sp. Z1491 TaxID=3416707 RepID=UPI003CF0075E